LKSHGHSGAVPRKLVGELPYRILAEPWPSLEDSRLWNDTGLLCGMESSKKTLHSFTCFKLLNRKTVLHPGNGDDSGVWASVFQHLRQADEISFGAAWLQRVLWE
jgi:hypothetical protein